MSERGGASAAALWASLFLRLSAREPQIAALFVLFPALLAVVYAGAYGPAERGLALRAIVVARAPGGEAPSRLSAALRSASFDGTSPMTVYESADLEASMRQLRDGAADIVLDASAERGGTGARIASAFVDPASAMGPYAESVARAAAASAFGPASVEPAWRTVPSFTGGSGGSSDFLIAVPGLFVFGWAFGAMTTALIAVREVRRRTLERASLAGGISAELAAGLWAAQAALGLLQAAALWAILPACGFPAPTRPLDAMLAVLVLDLPMSALATGCGLATAALCSSEGVAVNLSMAFIAPLAFLSGAVFPLPVPTLFEIGGYAVAAADFLPTAPATRALESILVRGASVASAAPAILAATIGSAAWAAGGAALFGRTRLSEKRRKSWVHR